MARTRAFDIERCLERATDLFWNRGYTGTSIQDLVAETGVERGSLYAAFGGKRGLFLAALEAYDRDVRRRRLAEAERTTSALGCIERVFRNWVPELIDGERRGCFLTNTAIELAPHDSEVAEIVDKKQAEIEAFFVRKIREAQAAGEVRPELDAASAGAGLLASLLGMLVLARSRPDRRLLETVAEDALVRLPRATQ